VHPVVERVRLRLNSYIGGAASIHLIDWFYYLADMLSMERGTDVAVITII